MSYVMHRCTAQREFTCKLGRGDPLHDAAQEQYNLRRRQVTRLEDGTAVERIGPTAALAAVDIEATALGLSEQVGVLAASPTAWAREATWMKVSE